MKCFRFRKLIVASAIGLTLGAATLGTSVLSEAAGPRQILSGWWDRRPTLNKLSDSKLNPRTWVSPSEKEKPGQVHLSKLMGRDSSGRAGGGQTVSVSRSDLYEDPFASGGESTNPAAGSESRAAVALKSASQAAPSPRQRREAKRRTEPTGQAGNQSIAHRSQVPKLPDGLEVASSDRSSEPGSSGNQFSDGFDQEFQRLIKSVIAETEEFTASGDTQAGRKLASGLGSARGPVSAPRISGSASGQSPLANGTNSMNDLIETSRRDMATAMTLPPDAGESPLITSHPGPRSIALTEGTARSQQVGQPEMMVPSLQTPGGTDRADLRNGWSGESSPARPDETTLRLASAPAKRPRVTSNVAPPQSVPNNRQYERMSYSSAEDGPLFGTVVEAPQQVVAARRQELDAAGIARAEEVVSSAPIIDWSLDANSSESTNGRSVPWGFASVLVTAVTTLLAILLLRKRQVVTVVASGTDAARETE